VSKRVCAESGCPALVDAGTRDGRCDQHRRERDRARGSSTDRGYGTEHQQIRAQWAPLVATGNVKCWRCREFIPGDAPWHLGHDDHDRSKYRGPEHEGCNTAVAGR
jgi:hypothetical protein